LISFGAHSTSNSQSNAEEDWQINLLQRADNPDVNLGAVRWVFTTISAPVWMIGDPTRALSADEKCRNLLMFRLAAQLPRIISARNQGGAINI
jgi:hypothetical protein